MSGSGARTIPTVLVARTPAAGREAEFEAWLRRLSELARQAPGHRHSDIQPPNEVHPGEWVIQYQFEDAGALRAWLASPDRAELIAAGAELVDGPAREQVVALAGAPDPVTGVASFRIRPGEEHRYPAFHDRLLDELAGFAGFAHCDLFEPVPGVQDDTVVAFSFDSREHLDAWLGSDRRRALLAEIEPHLVGERTVNVVGGFAGWFGGGPGEVQRWRQAAVVLLALFPTSLVLAVVRSWLLPDVHWTVGVLFGNVVGVIVLSWVLMPFLTRVLADWLRG